MATSPDEYVQQIEAAVDDETGLKSLRSTVATDKDLGQTDREALIGRAERYLYDFTKIRQADWRSSVTDEIMGGAINPDIGEEPT